MTRKRIIRQKMAKMRSTLIPRQSHRLNRSLKCLILDKGSLTTRLRPKCRPWLISTRSLQISASKPVADPRTACILHAINSSSTNSYSESHSCRSTISKFAFIAILPTQSSAMSQIGNQYELTALDLHLCSFRVNTAKTRMPISLENERKENHQRSGRCPSTGIISGIRLVLVRTMSIVQNNQLTIITSRSSYNDSILVCSN